MKIKLTEEDRQNIALIRECLKIAGNPIDYDAGRLVSQALEFEVIRLKTNAADRLGRKKLAKKLRDLPDPGPIPF